MNFPPIVFNHPKLSSLLTTSHPNQYNSSLISFQNILKKLSKFETKENNFQLNVINWLKSCNKSQLIKYFSINSQWFVDILKEMSIIAKFRPDSKFIFNAATKNDSIIISFFKLFDNNYIGQYMPQYKEYFTLYENGDEGVIDLGKKPEKENIQIKFLDNLRYLTLSKNKNEGKKYFFDYNNVVTFSLDYLTNFEKFIDTLLKITKNEIFKYPLDIESQINGIGNKYIYNIANAKWLTSPFTLTELLCSYFEQSVLLNYEYFLMFKEELTGLYYDKLDKHIEEIFKLVSFIGNSNEKKVEIFECIHPDEIIKTFNNNKDIKTIIDEKKNINDYFHSLYNPKYKFSKVFPKKEIVSSTLMDLQNLFIKSDLSFVIYMTFIKTSKIFTTEDFIIKIVYDMVNDFQKKKAAEDLLEYLSNDKKDENNNSNHKKRKKKKRKKNNKNEDNKENKDDSNIDENKISNKDENEVIKNIPLKEHEIKEEEKIDLKSQNNIILNKENNNNDSTDIKYLNKQENKTIEEKCQKEEAKEVKEEDKKEEKYFFLYPVVKNKKKKNKNKKKDKKHTNNNINNTITNSLNNINNEFCHSNSPKSESTKTNSSINYEISNNKNESQSTIHLSNEKEKEITNITKKKSDNINNNNNISQKPINKFNLSQNSYNEEIFNKNSNGNNGYFNLNKKENNISRSIENDKYLLAGSNYPNFTSFYFKSKKKKNRKNSEQNQFSFRTNNLMEFSKEIKENTQKVNKNKEILHQIREKYIKKIYESINIILKNENVNFLCAFYGSNISGLSIENSDIDIMVKIRKSTNEFNYIKRIMDTIVRKLNDNNNNELKYIKNINPIYTASIPVIKLECDLSYDPYLISEINNIMKNYNLSYNNLTKLFFDITFFEVENEQEKISSELMIDYIKQSTKLYPQIFDIIYIMKKFLFNRKLNQSYQGGISSFSLFLLILSFIKYIHQDDFEIPLGSLLLEFLRFYSNFDFYNSIIKPNEKETNNIYIIDKNINSFYKYNINIVDPITGFNVAKSTFKIEEIKKAFKDGLDIIIGNLYKVNNNDNNNEMNLNNININSINNNNKVLEHFFYDK